MRPSPRLIDSITSSKNLKEVSDISDPLSLLPMEIQKSQCSKNCEIPETPRAREEYAPSIGSPMYPETPHEGESQVHEIPYRVQKSTPKNNPKIFIPFLSLKKTSGHTSAYNLNPKSTHHFSPMSSSSLSSSE